MLMPMVMLMVEWLCTGPLPSACGVVWFGAGAPNHTQIVALAPSNQIKIKSWRWRPKSKSFMALAPPNQNQITSLIWAGAPNQNQVMALAPPNQIKSNRENHDFYTNACKLQAAPQRLRMLADVETKKAAVAAKAGLHR